MMKDLLNATVTVAGPSLPEDGILLVLPVPFKKLADGRLLCEEQATNGIDQWAEHFSHVTVAAPVLNEDPQQGASTVLWRDPLTLRHRDKVTLVPLPMAYTPLAFAASFTQGRRTLLQHITRNRYLSFGIGGLIGDWAALGARLAQSRGLPYSIHTDRVEHELMFKLASRKSLLRRLKAQLVGRSMRAYHRGIIRGCALGLWHGSDCFLAYSPWARENHLIHDIHLKPADAIPAALLAAKQSATRGRLRIVYAGRLDPMKAPLDWLRALGVARDLGVEFEAVWLGDGPLHDEFQACLDQLGLRDNVRTPGFVAERATLLAELRRAHVFVFTHITPESPRCLLEALASGSPIVGYKSAYAEELTAGRGGGAFVQLGDWRALGAKVAELAADRSSLAGLIAEAAENGSRFNDEAVFRERCELIRRFA
jgi:glycosyltransferase involved in cell wall biosynthesis